MSRIKRNLIQQTREWITWLTFGSKRRIKAVPLSHIPFPFSPFPFPLTIPIPYPLIPYPFSPFPYNYTGDDEYLVIDPLSLN